MIHSRGANLSYANLDGANLNGTLLDGANLSGITINTCRLRIVEVPETRFRKSYRVSNFRSFRAVLA
ncbi:MAG: pentapeptide repeat-containing protein [Stigonema ocellatum SAG 48.90 = DSM 106950]|nr:pentapeptide repeat-containing protein [Stigonema ocellatum SAG 48.90 = DSM 106950]